MRNAAGEEMTVPLKASMTFDDPEAMCQAAVLGLGATQIVMAHALRHLESGALVRLVPQMVRRRGIDLDLYASQRQMPAKRASSSIFVTGSISTRAACRAFCWQR